MKDLNESTSKVRYTIVCHEENSGEIYIKSKINGTKNTFYKSVKELYNSEWVDGYSKEDAAFLTVLYVSEKQQKKEIIQLLPRKNYSITKNVIFLGMLFTSFLILSNVTAVKIIEFSIPFLNNKVALPAALIFFPFTYFLDDALTEVYGFAISRYVIWGGLFCNALVSLVILFSIHLPAASFWQHQHEYSIVLGSTYRIFLASFLATFLGEFFNAILLSKLKILTSGRWLWLRVISSSSVGVGIDSIVFCMIAFYGIFPTHVLLSMILTQYLFKISFEIFALPLTYAITNYLKKKDKVDYYDFTTSYNPFKLKLTEQN